MTNHLKQRLFAQRSGRLLLSALLIMGAMAWPTHAVQIDAGGVYPPTLTPAPTGPQPAQILNRWTRTATDGNNVGTQGSPITLTWGIVADGTTINAALSNETTGPSSLVNFLDTLHGTGPGGNDLTQRPWFTYFNQSFERLEALSGVTYTYVPYDDGRIISGGSGFLNVRADVRIGGHSVDGSSGANTLAYNYFPGSGDMIIDTDNTSFFSSTSNNARALRNVLMHEAGHGLGFSHVESNNSANLMEPFINTSFDGPQFDDLLALHRNYGDTLEKNGGNNTLLTAHNAGTFSLPTTWEIGSDADNAVRIEAGESDFVSIDDDSDTDLYQFTLTDPATTLDAILTPYGPTYNEAEQGGTQTLLHSAALSDLVLDILDSNGTVIASSDVSLAGGTESVTAVALGAGDFFARITGKNDNVQIYGLEIFLLPEPATAALLFMLLAGRRRRRYLGGV